MFKEKLGTSAVGESPCIQRMYIYIYINVHGLGRIGMDRGYKI